MSISRYRFSSCEWVRILAISSKDCDSKETMKAYITCPVTHSQKRLDLLPLLEEKLRARGIETFVFEIGGSPEEIFQRDLEQLRTCDLLVAEVSEKSHGVGIEIGLSFAFGAKRILLHEEGTNVTPMATGMSNTWVISYKIPSEIPKLLTDLFSSPDFS